MAYTKIKQYSLLGVAVLALALMLTLFNPKHLALPLLILPFLFIFCIIFFSTKLLLPRRWLLQNDKRRTIIAGVLASLPVLLLVFQSIHQLTPRDVLVVLSLNLAGAFYISRADFIR